MKTINIIAIGLSLFAIACFSVDGVTDTEAMGIAFNCGLIGVNYALWRAK